MLSGGARTPPRSAAGCLLTTIRHLYMALPPPLPYWRTDPDLIRLTAKILAVQAGLEPELVINRDGSAARDSVDVAPGRTYFDLARFEMEAIAVVGFEVHVTRSSAPGAHIRSALTPPVAA